jgi:hypothetical protein
LKESSFLVLKSINTDLHQNKEEFPQGHHKESSVSASNRRAFTVAMQLLILKKSSVRFDRRDGFNTLTEMQVIRLRQSALSQYSTVHRTPRAPLGFLFQNLDDAMSEIITLPGTWGYSTQDRLHFSQFPQYKLESQ